MAAVVQKGDRFYCYFYHGGKRHSIAVGKTTQENAENYAERIEDILTQVRKGRMTIPEGVTVKEFIESDGRAKKAADASGVLEKLTLADLVEQYVTASVNSGGMEKNTAYTFRIHKSHITRVLGKKFMVRHLTQADLQRYVAQRSKEKHRGEKTISPDTVNKEIRTLRAAWNWARHSGIIKADFPGRGLRYGKSEEKMPFRSFAEVQALGGSIPREVWEAVYLEPVDIETMLDGVEAMQGLPSFVYPMILLVAHTGCRRSEMMRAKVSDLSLTGKTITIKERKRDKKKRTVRTVPLSPRLIKGITDWLDERGGTSVEELFLGTDGQKLTPKEATWWFHQALRGSRFEKIKGFHALRHSICSNLCAAGVDQRIIDDIVGHQSEEQRKRYSHLSPKAKGEALDRLFPHGGGSGKESIPPKTK